MDKLKPVSVKILSKAFQVTCPQGCEEQLQDATLYLDHKMREIRSQGRVIGLERIAIMAALNITHELLSFRQQKEAYVQSVTEQIEHLQNKIDEALMDPRLPEDV
jgi:cell division protein ZapA